MTYLMGAVQGVVAGAGYGLIGFGKSEGEQVDWKKLGTSVVIGAVAGLVAEVANLEIPLAYAMLVDAGMVVIVENSLKTLWRRWLSRFF